MPDNPFLDTNIIIYAFSADDPRSEKAYALLEGGGVISVQVLNELVNVWRRKQWCGWEEIQDGLNVVKVLLGSPQPLTLELHEAAVAIAQEYEFSIYDSLIIAAALRAG